MKPSTFALRAVLPLALVYGLFFLTLSPAKADSINSLNDFRTTDATGTIKGLYKVEGGNVDDTIDQTALNSLKVTGSEPNHSVSFYRKKTRDMRDDFSYDQHPHVAGLVLDSRDSEALSNFISAATF